MSGSRATSPRGAELHKLHVGTILRARAILTAEQQKKLEEPRPPRRPRPGMGPTSQAEDEDDEVEG